MKKVTLTTLLVLVLIMALTLSGCAQKDVVEAGAMQNPLLEEYIEEYTSEINRYDTPDGVFESESSYIMMSDAFVARILYPVTGNEEMDKVIEEYVQKIAAEQSKEAGDKYDKGSEPAELTMEYEADVIEGKYVGIKLLGTFNAPFMAHPYDIIKTFNGSVTEEKLLRITDLIAKDKLSQICHMIEKQTDVYVEYTEEELLD